MYPELSRVKKIQKVGIDGFVEVGARGSRIGFNE
jgi:hypothetical protein